MEKFDRRAFSLSFAALSLGAGLAGTARPEVQANAAQDVLNGARTFSQVGKELRPFLGHNEATLAEQEGRGYLDHMWFGGSFPNYTRTRLRVYVDGETTPSIDMELGLGVGVGFADPDAPWGTKWGGITGSPSGIFLNYRIPFSKHIRVTAELPAGVPSDTPFWWIVRGLLNHPLVVAGFTLPERARLRLHRNINLQVAPLDFFDLSKVKGDGMVFLVTMAAQSSSFAFLEGQMRAYIGGQSEPQFLSSGMEDYFLGTYYFNRGLYHLPQAGLTHKSETNHTFSAYRFHDIDPLLFTSGLRLSCRCGEMLATKKVAGPTGKLASTNYTTYAWIYEW